MTVTTVPEGGIQVASIPKTGEAEINHKVKSVNQGNPAFEQLKNSVLKDPQRRPLTPETTGLRSDPGTASLLFQAQKDLKNGSTATTRPLSQVWSFSKAFNPDTGVLSLDPKLVNNVTPQTVKAVAPATYSDKKNPMLSIPKPMLSITVMELPSVNDDKPATYHLFVALGPRGDNIRESVDPTGTESIDLIAENFEPGRGGVVAAVELTPAEYNQLTEGGVQQIKALAIGSDQYNQIHYQNFNLVKP